MSEIEIIDMNDFVEYADDYKTMLYFGLPANGVFRFKKYADIRYFKNGLLHNVIGPAIITANQKYWFLDGTRYLSEMQWFDALTSEQKQEVIWIGFDNI